MTTWISGRMGQFTYFNNHLGNPDWTGKRVLDFGGNVGNLLLDPNCRVEPKNYWCIDVSRDAIAEGSRRHSEAHFILYDRYNYEYNPTGTVELPIPDPGVRFDFIVAFSVFTHNSKAETLKLIDQLVALLSEEGRLAFTFLDPLWTPPPEWPYHIPESEFNAGWTNLYRMMEKWHGGKPPMDLAELLARGKKAAHEAESAGWSNLRWRLGQHHVVHPETDVAGLLAQAEKADLTWAALVSGERLVVDPDDDGFPQEEQANPADHRLWGYLSFCTAEYMSALFPHAQIRTPHGDRQHCAIIDARHGTGRQ